MSEQHAFESYLDPRDQAHAASLAGPERETVVATVSRYRRPDRLRVGDRLPLLELTSLEDRSRVTLDSLVVDRPLTLVFGSFT